MYRSETYPLVKETISPAWQPSTVRPCPQTFTDQGPRPIVSRFLSSKYGACSPQFFTPPAN